MSRRLKGQEIFLLLQDLDEEKYKDATSIMQLLKDNLTLWNSELEEEEENK